MIGVIIYFVIGALISIWVDSVVDRSKIQDKDSKTAKYLVDLFVICVWPAFLLLFIKSTIEAMNDKEEEQK